MLSWSGTSKDGGLGAVVPVVFAVAGVERRQQIPVLRQRPL
jgi:hypothetical protein